MHNRPMADIPAVICLGEALVDRLGPPGGDPAVDQPVDDRLGGAPANVACALARLGTATAFIGRLGDDANGQAFRQLFRERGVDQRAMQNDAQRPTRVVLVRRSAGGERQFRGLTVIVARASRIRLWRLRSSRPSGPSWLTPRPGC